MSLYGMQSALAALIRCPEPLRTTDLKTFLSEYPLDATEWETITSLAKLPELNAYGRELADGRVERLARNVYRVPRFVDKKLLGKLCLEHYELTALHTNSDLAGFFAYSLGFLHFLQFDPYARAVLEQEAPPFAQDLIRFEACELELSVAVCEPSLLKADSALQNICKDKTFKVLHFSYDIPFLIQKGEAKERDLSLLFVRRGPRLSPRMFEISADVREYLAGEQGDGPRRPFDSSWQEGLTTVFGKVG